MTSVTKRAQRLHSTDAYEGAGASKRVADDLDQLYKEIRLIRTLVDGSADFAQLNADIPRKTKTESAASPYQITLAESGTLFDDVGATAATGFKLPASSGLSHIRRKSACVHYYFQNTSALDMTITVGDEDTDTIEVGGSAGGVTSWTITRDNENLHLVFVDDRWRAITPVQRIGCRVSRTAGLTVSDNTATDIPFTAEEWDTHGFHDNSTNNTRATVPAGMAGVYDVGGASEFDQQAVATGVRLLRVKHYNSGGTLLSIAGVQFPPSSANSTFMAASLPGVIAAAGDYFTVEVYQTSGGNLTLGSGATGILSTRMTVERRW